MKYILLLLVLLVPTTCYAQDVHYGKVVQEEDMIMFYLNGEIPLLSFETENDEVPASPLLFSQRPDALVKYNNKIVWIETTGMSIVDFGQVERKLIKPIVGSQSDNKVKGKILSVRDKTEYYEIVVKGPTHFLMRVPASFDYSHLADCVKANKTVMVYYTTSARNPAYTVTGYSLFR